MHYRHWGNEWAVFDVGSGQTHQLDTVSAVALMHCENGWITLPEVVAGVISELELPTAPHLPQSMLLLLDQFTTLGLLEHISE